MSKGRGVVEKRRVLSIKALSWRTVLVIGQEGTLVGLLSSCIELIVLAKALLEKLIPENNEDSERNWSQRQKERENGE